MVDHSGVSSEEEKCAVAYEWSKEKGCYETLRTTPEQWFGSIAGRRLPPRHKSPSIELLSQRAVTVSACPRHMSVATFGMHVNKDATVVGVVDEKWQSKGPTPPIT